MAIATPHLPRHATLKRQIGLYACIAITIGNIIGSGIFKAPNSVARVVEHVPLMIGLWIIGGILSLCGSLALIELAVAHPKTGGLYVFLREGFGHAASFTFGWANFWVIKPTLIATTSLVFAEHFCDAVRLTGGGLLLVGYAAILLLTSINALGVRQGVGTASLFTTLKVVGITALCIMAFLLPHSGAPIGTVSTPVQTARPFLVAIGLGMIPVLFAYDGWTDVTYIAGEVLTPKRNLPIALVWGTMLVIVIYLMVNLAYLHVLTPAEVAAYPAVGAETMRRVVGGWGSTAFAILVAVSAFGTLNGAILTGPRVTLAMAEDGLLWRPLAHVDSKRSSPDRALWAQAVLSCLWLSIARSFEDASNWFVTTMWLFYGLTTGALFIQRRREAHLGRKLSEYRTPLYPLTPVVFILVTLAIIVSDISSSGWRAAVGVIIAGLGFPVYYLIYAKRDRELSPPGDS